MRVAVDATPLIMTSGGLVRYTHDLVMALAAEFPEDSYYLVSDQKFTMPEGAPVNVSAGTGPRHPLERRWWLWGVQREMRRLGAELFHGPNFSVPYLPVKPAVMTLHDLSPWMNPSWHGEAARVRRRTPLLIRLGAATMVITDSAAVRRQAIEKFGIDPARIVAVPLAAREQFRPAPAVAVERPYFLFVGTIEPRKNVTRLVEAWRPVWQRHGVELVLAGRVREDASPPPQERGLRLLGEVRDAELPGLYSGCLAFAYPSLYEGFGLPVLEAMQCGACVLTSRDAAVGEVCGEAAMRIEATDVPGWTEALEACVTQPEMVRGRREASRRRAREFSWRRTARETREVYAEAMRRFRR